MHTIGRMALTVAAGGVVLGMLLGKAADPVMKRAPVPAWSHLLQERNTAGEADEAEAFVASFDPYMGPDSYAPAFAHEVVLDWEPDYPSWTYSDFTEEVQAIGEEDDVPPIETLPVAPDEPLAPQDAVPLAEATPPDGLEPLY
jgi:hypothetical protein